MLVCVCVGGWVHTCVQMICLLVLQYHRAGFSHVHDHVRDSGCWQQLSLWYTCTHTNHTHTHARVYSSTSHCHLPLCTHTIDLPVLLQCVRGCYQLRKLVVNGNPVSEEPKLRHYITKALPCLATLDNNPLRTKVQ